MNNNILTSLQSLADEIPDSPISPICPSSMLFTKLKQLYLQEARKLKKQQTQTQTSVFTLCLKQKIPSAPIPHHSSSIIPSSIQDQQPISTESIKSLIKIYNIVDDYTSPDLMAQLEDCIFRKIRGLNKSEETLSMFTKIAYIPKYLQRGLSGYSVIEDRLIKELLTMSFSKIDSNLLVKFVFSLPYRTRSLLPLLSHFIEQSNSQSHIKILYELFSSLFPAQPTKDQISCLLSISTKQATQRVNMMVKQHQIKSLDMLEREAKRKLKRVPDVFNSKGEAIMMFVYFVAIFGGDIWEDIIEWEKTAIQQYKEWFKNNAKSIVSDNHAKDHLEVILLKLTNISYQSEISELFFDHVVEMKSKEMFNSVIIKRFLASKVYYKLERMRDDHQRLADTKLKIIFDSGLIFVDILLQLFENENKSKVFYSYMLQSGEQNAQILTKYLDQCYNSHKFKFVEFFIKFISTSKSEILEVNSNALLHYFLNIIDFELAYILTKEMSLSNPSKYYIVFMKAWFFQKFTGEDDLKALKSTIIRSINILLIRNQIEFNKQFVAHFKQNFYSELNQEERSKIMTDVTKNRRDLLGV